MLLACAHGHSRGTVAVDLPASWHAVLVPLQMSCTFMQGISSVRSSRNPCTLIAALVQLHMGVVEAAQAPYSPDAVHCLQCGTAWATLSAVPAA